MSGAVYTGSVFLNETKIHSMKLTQQNGGEDFNKVYLLSQICKYAKNDQQLTLIKLGSNRLTERRPQGSFLRIEVSIHVDHLSHHLFWTF